MLSSEQERQTMRSSPIFRSDFNKEILADFSGAGLYDSIML